MAWPAYWPLATGTDIQTNDATDDLETAAGERFYAATAGEAIDGGAVPLTGVHHTPGDEIQSASIYAAVEMHTRAMLNAYVDYTDTWAAGKDVDPTLWSYTKTTFETRSGVSSDGFAFTYPREINDPSDTTFVDGDSPAGGDKALNTTDGLVYSWNGASFDLLGPHGIHRATRNTVHREVGDPTGFATILAGDYLTENATVFNEVYAAANALVWTNAATAVTLVTGHTNMDYIQSEARTGENVDDPTLAAAYANALSDYDANAVTVGGADRPRTFSESGSNTPAGHWQVVVEVHRAQFSLSLVDSALSYTGTFFAYIERKIEAGNTETFDANGTGYTEDDWSLINSDGPSDLDKASDWVGNNPNTPYHPNSVTIASEDRGFELLAANDAGDGSDVNALLKWNVGGGFTMV